MNLSRRNLVLGGIVLAVLCALTYVVFSERPPLSLGSDTQGRGTADGVTVSGNQLMRSGAPFSIKGMLVTGTNFTPAYLEKIKSTGNSEDSENYAAYQEWILHGADELAAIKKFGANTVKFYFSQYGFDPESQTYSQAYVDQDIAAIKLARSQGLIVIAGFQAYSGIASRQAGQDNADMPFDGTVRALSVLARAVGSDQGVLIEPYHRPALPATADNWRLWLEGGIVKKNGLPTVGYQALVDGLRQEGAKNIIILGALDSSRNYSGMPEIDDPLSGLVYGIDGYTYLNPKATGALDGPALWQAHYGFLLDQGKPVVVTEWNEPTGATPSGGSSWCSAQGLGYPLTIPAEMIRFWTEKAIGVVGFATDKPNTVWLDPGGTPSTFVGKRCGDEGGGPGILLEQKFGIFDTVKPTAPTGLGAKASGSVVTLTWSPSTDNVYVAAYDIYRDGVLLATQNATSTAYTDRPPSGTSHAYYVTALDASANSSSESNTVSITPTP